jgi:hypothetical protein
LERKIRLKECEYSSTTKKVTYVSTTKFQEKFEMKNLKDYTSTKGNKSFGAIERKVIGNNLKKMNSWSSQRK